MTRVAQRLIALLRLLDVPRAPTQRLGDGGAGALPAKKLTAQPFVLASRARVPRYDVPEERSERVHHVGGFQTQKRSLLRVRTRRDVPRGDVSGVSGAAFDLRRRGERRRLRQRRHLRRRRREALELLLERRVGRVRTAEQAGDELHGALPADDLLVRGAPARDSRQIDVVGVILSLRIMRVWADSDIRVGKGDGQTRAFRRVRARRTGQESALVAVRDATLESAVVLEESRAARRRDQPGRAKSSLGHAEGRFTAKKRRPERRTTRGDARGDEPRIAPIGGGRRYRAAIDARTHLSL